MIQITEYTEMHLTFSPWVSVFCMTGLSCWEYSHIEPSIFWASSERNKETIVPGEAWGMCEKMG